MKRLLTTKRVKTFSIGLLLLLASGCGPKAAKFGIKFFPFKGRLPRGFVEVPGGSFTIGITSDETSSPRRISTNSLYVYKTCISNGEYKTYVEHLRDVYLDEQSEEAKESYEKAKLNGDVWKRSLAYHDSLIRGYGELSRFTDYPAVVTWQQAQDWCDFMTEQLRQREAPPTAASTDPEDPNDPDNEAIDDFAGGYRLLTAVEWEVMAAGIVGAYEPDQQDIPRLYPWDGLSLRDDNGRFRATFKRGKGDYKGPPGEADNSAPTVRVDEHPPNDLGIYLFCGVCEWTADTYRPSDATSQGNSEDFNPYRRDGTLDAADNYDSDHSLVNDNARVYKGCSWKDPYPYLEMGKSRYADKDKPGDEDEPKFIGFRPVYYGDASP